MIISFSDDLLVMINNTNVISLSEILSFNSTMISFNYTTPTGGITSDIELEHNTIEINKPVVWTHNVTFYNNTDSIAIEIPADAEILTVKTLNDTSETLIFNSTDFISNLSNSTGLYDDEDISDKDLKKHFRLLDSIQTIETKINNTSDKISYYASLDTAKAHKKLDKLNEKLDKLENKLENKLGKISDTVPLASLKQVNSMLQDDKPLKVLVINSTDSNVELTFTTPSAYSEEQNNSTNDKFEKKITIAHESALHYTNVTAYSDIPETLVSEGVQFKLFWNINNTRVDVTDDPRFAVEYVDTDDNKFADQMRWTVPQLSEQEFDIEADLEVINVQSYPAVGGVWKVLFTTNGTADLTITAINGQHLEQNHLMILHSLN